MSPTDGKTENSTQKRVNEIRKLRSLEHEATHGGRKLAARDRLRAAFHLSRAWNEAKKSGLRKEDFQDAILPRLKRPHGKRQEFRLANWVLRRGEDPKIQQDLVKKYENKTTPQKALEPYLVGITVAAEYCGADPDDWKLAMAHDLSIWSRPLGNPEIMATDDRPAETLAVLLNALSAKLAQKNRLSDTFDAIRRMSCRWDMYDERLIATNELCMEPIDSPISPICDDSIYFEEMFPFPSIALVRVPYFVGKGVFFLAPEQSLRLQDEGYLSSGMYLPVGAPFKGLGTHYSIPADAPDHQVAHGAFSWYREIRLCIVPDGRGNYVAALETRPRFEVSFDETFEFAGRHCVIAGFEIDLERGLFYGRTHDGQHIWPHIQDSTGKTWRITVPHLPDDGLPFSEWSERNPETTGWMFDPDPVLRPGESSEPWYLSYTPASAPYLRHWLTQNWKLENELAVCLWSRDKFASGNSNTLWERNLPRINELNFPDFSHATWIECCLHNGLIEEALQAKIDRLKEQTARLQTDWHVARDNHSNALLRRWNAETNEGDYQ